MKRILSLLLVFTMLMGLLSACGTAAQQSAGDADMVPFDEMPYARPDLNAALARIETVRALLEGSIGNDLLKLRQHRKLRGIETAFDACFADYYDLDTMQTLARIRSDRDTTDDAARTEAEWCSDAMVTYYAALEDLFAACAASSYADALEAEYFGAGYLDAYGEDYVSSEELTALRRTENDLVNQYFQAISSASVSIGGTDYTLDALYDAVDSGTLPFSASEAYSRYYEAVNAEIGQIYVNLVQTRQAIAAALGYDSYQELAYEENGYACAQADIAAYTEAIRAALVPLYTQAAERDLLEDALYGTARQESRDSLDAVSQMAETFGGDFAEAMDFMLEYDLFDVSVSEKKAADSYEMYLSNYEAPYLFTNSYGYEDDTLTIAHEFGHYTDDFVHYGAGHSTDVSETLSQGMEYLALCCLADDDLRESLTAYKLADVLRLYAEQGSYNAFEEAVYALDPDEVTLEAINAISLRTAQEYGMQSAYGERYDATSWITISHFFEAPFYILSYMTSDSMAIQFYELERAAQGAGLAAYQDAMKTADDQTLAEFAAALKLDDPVSPDQIRRIADLIRQELLDPSA